MSQPTFSEPKPGILSVAGDLRVEHAGEFARRLICKLDEQPSLHVELLNVSDADVSTLQVMLMGAREAERQGKQLRWLGYGACLEDLVNLLGMSEELGGPLAVIWE
jgi:ABC-type transporter Mla MlaB component